MEEAVDGSTAMEAYEPHNAARWPFRAHGNVADCSDGSDHMDKPQTCSSEDNDIASRLEPVHPESRAAVGSYL